MSCIAELVQRNDDGGARLRGASSLRKVCPNYSGPRIKPTSTDGLRREMIGKNHALILEIMLMSKGTIKKMPFFMFSQPGQRLTASRAISECVVADDFRLEDYT
jgi:hypothetical protein